MSSTTPLCKNKRKDIENIFPKKIHSLALGGSPQQPPPEAFFAYATLKLALGGSPQQPPPEALFVHATSKLVHLGARTSSTLKRYQFHKHSGTPFVAAAQQTRQQKLKKD